MEKALQMKVLSDGISQTVQVGGGQLPKERDWQRILRNFCKEKPIVIVFIPINSGICPWDKADR